MASTNFSNPAECLEVLRRLHPTSVDESHRLLSQMVAALLKSPPAPNQHLEVLEAARGAIAFVQTQMSNRYAAHPLPPDSVENETLARVTTLWQNLSESYALVMERDAENSTLLDQYALVCQRRIYYAGYTLLEYYRAHRAMPPTQWTRLHQAYAVAEQREVARVRVADPLNEVWKAQSPTEAYVAILLVDLANPFGRSQREFGWVCRWAQRFSPYSVLQASSDNDAPAKYGLDLTQDHGLRPIGLLAPSDGLRRFDGQRLAGQIQAVLRQFKQGVTPASLGLGEDCPSDSGGRLLLSLYRPWGLSSAGRRFTRRGTRGTLQLTSDWPAIAFYVQGRPFEAPKPFGSSSTVLRDFNVVTFGERAPEAPMDADRRRAVAIERGYFCQTWQILDQSVGGFRMQRHPQGERIEYHQLVGLRPEDVDQFLLAQVSWLMYRADGTMEAGIYMLPGIPEVKAVRQLGLRAGSSEPYQLGFLLPPVPALKTGATLVLPGGWYQPQRVVELHGRPPLQVRLAELVRRGTNFDQVSFVTLGPAE